MSLVLAFGAGMSALFASPVPVGQQQRLFRDFGIRAVDRTDRHSPPVLANFALLLRKGFPPGWPRRFGGVRELYAYGGHDAAVDLGAYHPSVRAISIGGISAYPAAETQVPDLRILATLAHELGHAFLLKKVPLAELREIGARFGGWAPVLAAGPIDSYYAKPLFKRHPASEDPALAAGGGASGGLNLCSRLAETNIHEWFADAFAAVVLARVGATGALGTDWRKQLAWGSAAHPHEYWYDYNRVSDAFAAWLNAKLDAI